MKQTNARIKSISEAKQAAAEGTALGENGLFRLNYFNGRMLTAEALRKEQIYWDTRARLLGEIHPAGIAWGLGLRWKSNPALPAPGPQEGTLKLTGGVLSSEPVTLDPGLAFDGSGRPIVVGAQFEFAFKDLVDGFVSHQVVVVDGGTQFAPCVCLAPIPKGKWTPGPALPPGPYLLVIAPTETPEDEAKVYVGACATTKGVLCEADGFRGGFALSLARFPVDVPLDDIPDFWTLQSVLSSYYFDVFEHSLIARWQRPFPFADGQVDFSAGTGRLDAQATAVPLAMVYVGNDGSILFLDTWIPRRPLASTAALSWSANLRGAPTPSACIARLHQFQSQLEESVTAAGGLSADSTPKNLYDLGFRSLPPFGFLPIPERSKSDKPVYFDEPLVFADRYGKAYFRGTNVFVYGVVALHDDDIFEDMVRVLEKDPIQLQPCTDEDERGLTVRDLKSLLALLGKRKTPAKEQPAPRPTDQPADPIEIPTERPIEVEPIPGVRDSARRARSATRTGTRARRPPAAAARASAPAARAVEATQPATTDARVVVRDEAPGRELQVREGDRGELIHAVRLLKRILMPCGGITMERLINREIEVVKLVVPMEGLKRVHPIVGAVKADLSVSPFGVWSLVNQQKVSGGKGTRLEALLSDVLGTSARPHGFVLYVKHRIVLLDVLYIVLDAVLDSLAFVIEVLTTVTLLPQAQVEEREATIASKGLDLLKGVGLDEQFLQAIFESFIPAYTRKLGVGYYSTQTLRGLVAVRPLKAVGALVGLFADPSFRALLLLLLLESAGELGFSKTWDAYDDERQRVIDKGKDALIARDAAIDLLLNEHAGFGMLKLLVISLPDKEFDDLEEALRAETVVDGEPNGKMTLAQEIFYSDRKEDDAYNYNPWKSTTAATLFFVARRIFGERSLSDIAPDVQVRENVSLNRVLGDTASAVESWVEPKTDGTAIIVSTLRKLGSQMVEEANPLSGAVADSAFWNEYDKVLAESDNDVATALKRLTGGAANKYLEAYHALAVMFEVLGNDGYGQFVTDARKVGGV